MSDAADYKILQCATCGWIYDEEQGDAEEGLAPGTRWADVPASWCCPSCGTAKSDFTLIEL